MSSISTRRVVSDKPLARASAISASTAAAKSSLVKTPHLPDFALSAVRHNKLPSLADFSIITTPVGADLDITLTEQEACYQVVQLVKTHPSLGKLLLKLKNDGVDWVQILRMLRQALKE
jgi:hypothetical protein